jgi:hypothetical protein
MAAGIPAALAVVRLQQGRVADAGPLVRQEASLVLGRVLRVKAIPPAPGNGHCVRWHRWRTAMAPAIPGRWRRER